MKTLRNYAPIQSYNREFPYGGHWFKWHHWENLSILRKTVH